MLRLSALAGLVLMVIGVAKAWFHMTATSTIAFPTCNGGSVLVAVGTGNWFERAHCWGCYAALLGFALIAAAAVLSWRQRRPAALRLD